MPNKQYNSKPTSLRCHSMAKRCLKVSRNRNLRQEIFSHVAGAYSMGINIAIVTLFWRSCSTHICRPCRPVCNSCRPIADQLQTGLQTIADHINRANRTCQTEVVWLLDMLLHISPLSNIKPSLNRQHIVTYYHQSIAVGHAGKD